MLKKIGAASFQKKYRPYKGVVGVPLQSSDRWSSLKCLFCFEICFYGKYLYDVLDNKNLFQRQYVSYITW